MRKLDQRGTAAFEFCVIAVVFFTTIFTIFDLARYAMTVQSLRMLAGAGARAIMIKDCYMDAAIYKKTPDCSGDPLPLTADKQTAAPFLFSNGSTSPTLSLTGAAPYTITAAQPGFNMLMPIWGSSLNGPSASTKLPFPG